MIEMPQLGFFVNIDPFRADRSFLLKREIPGKKESWFSFVRLQDFWVFLEKSANDLSFLFPSVPNRSNFPFF